MIAIVGGGISGLAAAYELSVRGVPFTLFEASPRLGGLIRTERVGGFTIEAGADSMLAQKRVALALCAELGLEARLIPTKSPRTAFVLHQGRLHPLPSPSMFGLPATWKGLLDFDLLSPVARVRVALEPLVPRRPQADESIGSFFRRRFGEQVVERLAQPLIGGIHAGDVEELSLRTLIPRLADAEAHGSVLGWVRRVAGARDPNGAFRSLAAGMSELVDAIHRRLPAGSVKTDAPVVALHQGPRVATPHESIDCAGVIIAAPAHAAAEMLRTLDPEAARLCSQTRYVSTASVALAWPREALTHPLNGSGFVVAPTSNRVRITACTWVSSKFAGRAPSGHVLLRAFLGGAQDPSVVDLSDQELIDTVTGELSGILGTSGAPELVRVFRWRDAGAQHDVGQAARVTELERRLAAHPGIFVAGSGFRTAGIPDCIADGRAIASAAASFARL